MATACGRPVRPPATVRPAPPPITAPSRDSATQRLVDAAHEYPLLADYADWATARAAERARDLAGARRHATAVLDARPTIWAGPAMLLLARVAERAGETEAAIGWYEAARGSLDADGTRWLRATLALAELRREAGPVDEALALAAAVREGAPRSLAARRARRLVDGLRPIDSLRTAPALRTEAEQRLREGDAGGALEAAIAALRAATDDAEQAAALWARARAERALGGQTTAEATCREIAERFPNEPVAASALSAAARWRWNADEDARASALFSEVRSRFPRSAAATEAIYAIGRIHQEAGRMREAETAYEAVARRWPRSRLGAECRWRVGWVHYLAGDWAGAAERFHQAAGRPGARTVSRYWHARSLERAGRTDEARRRYTELTGLDPTSYYAGLAETRLGREPTHGTVPATTTRPAFPAALTGVHAARARLLLELGAPRLARREVDAIRTAGAPAADLALAYEAAGAAGAALRLAAAVRGAAPDLYERRRYPLGYWNVVYPEARAHGIDPLLAAALIRQESLFDPEAISPANARGLMQLLPATATAVARELGVRPPAPRELRRPETNVALGMGHLADLLARYDGTVEKALAAYNGGVAAVSRWETRYGDRPMDEFVELISYRETRGYVKAVLSGRRVYERLWAESPSVTSTGSPPKAPFDMIAMTSPGRADATR